MKNTRTINTLALAAAAVATTLVLGGCSTTSPTKSPETAPSALTVFEHVHGLSIDSHENVLVASHSGIYRVGSDGELSGPLGGEPFDAMGFASAGDDYFASGHPSPGSTSFEGPNLGLLSSSDAGETWHSVSLAGVVDFHALTVNQSDATRLYGLPSDGSPLLASTDGGASWTEGASIQAHSLLADPNTTDQLFATTADGVAVSENAGQSFRLLADTPPLYLLAAARDIPGAFAGVGVEGNIWLRESIEKSWFERSTVEGTASAITVGGDGQRIVLLDDRGLVESFDAGKSWTVLIAS